MPEKRLNSRGHLVTKWVKPEDARRSSWADFSPPVSKNPRPSISDQRDAVLEVLEDKKGDESYDVATFVYGAKDTTLTFLYDHFASDDEDGAAAWEIAWMAKEYYDDETIIAYIALYEIHEDTLDDIEEVAAVVAGLHTSGNNREPLDPNDEDSVERNAALLKFSLPKFTEDELVQSADWKSYCVANQGIAHLVYDNPERFDEIVDFLDKHHDLTVGRDQSAIEELLNDAANIDALTEGRL